MCVDLFLCVDLFFVNGDISLSSGEYSARTMWNTVMLIPFLIVFLNEPG